MNQPLVSTQGWVDASQGVVRREAFVSDDVYRQELARIFERQLGVSGARDGNSAAGQLRGPHAGQGAGDRRARQRRQREGDAQQLPPSRREALPLRRRHRAPLHLPVSRLELRTRRPPDHHDVRRTHAGRNGFRQMGPHPRARGRELSRPGVGSWNPDVADLETVLAISAVIHRPGRTPGGMQVLAPPHRWRAKANWKVGALNFIGDSRRVHHPYRPDDAQSDPLGPRRLHQHLRSQRAGHHRRRPWLHAELPGRTD